MFYFLIVVVLVVSLAIFNSLFELFGIVLGGYFIVSYFGLF